MRFCRPYLLACLFALFDAFAGGRADIAPLKQITFHEHVAPILLTHCAACHRPGQSGPFPLLTYADAKKRAREIAEVTGRRYMPPWPPAPGYVEFIGERRLTDADIETLQRWLAAGTPEGDPAKSPPVPDWPTDWQLGPPDLIVKMPVAYTVPADGRDVYRNFVVPVANDRRRYVAAWELRPHSRAVHHAFLRVDRTGEGRRRDALDPEPGFPGMDTPPGIQSPDGHFASWQPGARARREPAGLPWTLEPGADLVLKMHLQPLGKPEPLQAEIGLYFTDQPPTNQPIKLGPVNYAIDLPPGSTNVVVTDDVTLPADAHLLGLLPHTHYLGHRIEAIAHLPDGGERMLLLIPDWDFNWQGDYMCKEPVLLPAGTRVEMRISFDNSTNNVRNPSNPPRRVQFGPNTTDEMAELWLQFLPLDAAGAAKFREVNVERTIRDSLAYNLERLRLNPNDGAAHVNLGRTLLAQRKPDEARRHFADAVAAAPDLDEAHYYLGLVNRMAGQLAAAAAEFKRTLELNPNHVRAHGNLGLMNLEAGRPDVAASHFADAIRLDPTDSLAHAMLGSIRLQQGRPREALPLLQRAVELDPNDAEARQNLTLTQQRLGLPQPAK